MMTPGSPAGSQDYGKRDTDFVMTVTRNPGLPRGFLAALKTTKVYPCTGYDIRLGLSWSTDTLTLNIGGLRRPSPCVQLSAEATGSIFLGDIGDGRYVLRIRYRSDEELHHFRVTNGKVFVTSEPKSFTRIMWH